MPSVTLNSESANNVRLAEEIFAKHGCFIQTVIKCRVRDEHLRNDIFHDYFLSLVRRPIPENVTNVKGYIYRAICNDIYDSLRKSDCYGKHLLKHYQTAANSKAELAADSRMVEMEEVCKMFELMEAHLFSSEAKVLRLRYQSELTNQEIAKRLNLGNATVDTYMSTALKKLRGILNREKERGYE